MELLNNREIASAIWVLIFAAWAFSHRKIRSSFGSILNIFFKKVIFIPFSLLIIYTLTSVWILNQVGIWDSSQTKNTIIWFFCIATISIFRSNEIADNPNYFKNTVKDNLKIIVFIEFLVEFYTFNLIIELMFIPFMAILGGLVAVSQANEKYALVNKALIKLIEIIGLFIIIYIGYRLVIDFNDFAQVQTAFDFFVPITLSIFLLPFIYLCHVYMVYENIFVRIQFFITNEKLYAYAKRSAIIKYKFNLSALRRWANTLNGENFFTNRDIDKSHEEIVRQESEENDPPTVQFILGWSPYKISSALEIEGLSVGHYKKQYEEDWFASSPYLEIGKGILPNNIAYYLEGNRFAVTKLKLKMNINEQEQSEETHTTLCNLASALHLHALERELAEGFKKAIMNGGNKVDQVKTKLVCVSTEHWQNNRGYSVCFSISNNNAHNKTQQ